MTYTWKFFPRTVLGELLCTWGDGERRNGKEYYAIKVEISSEDRPRRNISEKDLGEKWGRQIGLWILVKSEKTRKDPLRRRVFWW